MAPEPGTSGRPTGPRWRDPPAWSAPGCRGWPPRPRARSPRRWPPALPGTGPRCRWPPSPRTGRAPGPRPRSRPGSRTLPRAPGRTAAGSRPARARAACPWPPRRSPSRPAAQVSDVALGGLLQRALPIRGDDPAPPPAVDPVEGEGPQPLHDPRDRALGQGDEVGVAPHEADVAAVLDHRGRVAHEKGPLSVCSSFPVEDRAPLEVPAGLNQRHTGGELHAIRPESDGGVVSHHPLPVGLGDVDRGSAERAAPLHHRSVEVRMRERDGRDPPAVPELLHDVAVDQADAVPQHVAVGRGNQQRARPDAERWLRADPDQPEVVADVVTVSLRSHLLQRRPLLPLPADVLALVLADRAALGRT